MPDDAAVLRIETLGPARRDDFLRFFDHARGDAFADNPEWAPCYCHYHHVSPRVDWHALDGDANRMAMDARIACGEMQGYLAYRGERVVGWLNAQPRNRLRHCDARIGVKPPALPVREHECAAIACFVVAPAHRHTGVARTLLDAALLDLAARGVRVVDAYPRADEGTERLDRDHYRGPRSLFVTAGFEPLARDGDVQPMRKWLDLPAPADR